jgi:hypothetical protein
MTVYNINMAKNHVVPASKRRKNFHFMTVYLLFCGLLLVDAAFQAGNVFRQSKETRAMRKSLLENFKEKHPGSTDIPRYIAQLSSQIKKQEAELSALNTAIEPPVPLGPVLHALLKEAPATLQLVSLEMRRDPKAPDATFVFHLEPGKGESSEPATWLRKWKEDAELKKYLLNLSLTGRNDNLDVAEQKVTEFRCSAELTKRGL